jgi:hypothetical protein
MATKAVKKSRAKFKKPAAAAAAASPASPSKKQKATKMKKPAIKKQKATKMKKPAIKMKKPATKRPASSSGTHNDDLALGSEEEREVATEYRSYRDHNKSFNVRSVPYAQFRKEWVVEMLQ